MKCKLLGCNKDAHYLSSNGYCSEHEELHQREKKMEEIAHSNIKELGEVE